MNRRFNKPERGMNLPMPCKADFLKCRQPGMDYESGGNSYLLQGEKDTDSGLAPPGKARYIYGFQFKTQ